MSEFPKFTLVSGVVVYFIYQAQITRILAVNDSKNKSINFPTINFFVVLR